MKVALLADIHSNIFALEAVLADLDKEKVDRILVVGDLVGYYYWPAEVLSFLRNDTRFVCVRGNHEANLREAIDDASAAERYRKKYGSGYDVCLSDLSSDDIDWLVNLPLSCDLEIGGSTFHLSHGAIGSIDTYIYPDAKKEDLVNNVSGKDYTVFGHTHYPFIYSEKEKSLINPGSVGQPRDVGGLASFAILNLENNVIQFKRRSFDTDQLRKAAMKRDPQLAYLWNILSR